MQSTYYTLAAFRDCLITVLSSYRGLSPRSTVHIEVLYKQGYTDMYLAYLPYFMARTMPNA